MRAANPTRMTSPPTPSRRFTLSLQKGIRRCLKLLVRVFYQTCWTQKYPHNLTAKEEVPVNIIYSRASWLVCSWKSCLNSSVLHSNLSQKKSKKWLQIKGSVHLSYKKTLQPAKQKVLVSGAQVWQWQIRLIPTLADFSVNWYVLIKADRKLIIRNQRDKHPTGTDIHLQ